MSAVRLHSLPVARQFRIIFAMIPKVTSSLCAIEKHFRSLDEKELLFAGGIVGLTRGRGSKQREGKMYGSSRLIKVK